MISGSNVADTYTRQESEDNAGILRKTWASSHFTLAEGAAYEAMLEKMAKSFLRHDRTPQTVGDSVIF